MNHFLIGLTIVLGCLSSFANQIDLQKGQATQVSSTVITCEKPTNGQCNYFSEVGQVICGEGCQYIPQVGQVKCAQED